MNPDHTHLFLMSMLSMSISFPIFQMCILCTLSMHIRNGCMNWECTSGNDAYPEHTCQELMCCWAYASGTGECTEHMCQELMHAQSAVHSKNPEHMHQELLHTLSIYASVSYAHAQHKRKNSRLEKVPSKHAEHTHKELMRSLSFCVRNCCSSSSCASEIKWWQARPKN
jgi:hypothetical protein